METIKIDKIGKWDAVVTFNDETYTISYAYDGGAIVFDSDLEKAKIKFIQGMELFESLKTILQNG